MPRVSVCFLGHVRWTSLGGLIIFIYLFFFEGNRGGVELGEGGVGVLRGVEGGEAAVKMVLYERRIKVLKNIEWKTLLHR